MMTNPHVVAELRSLFRQGSTPSRLIGHIVASHPAEPSLPALVNAYFRDAFHIPFVRLAEMPTGNGTTELLYAHLNADLVHEIQKVHCRPPIPDMRDHFACSNGQRRQTCLGPWRAYSLVQARGFLALSGNRG